MTAPALSDRDLAVLRSFARRIDPADAGAHNNLGVLYYQKGLIAEAIAEFSRALELDPKMQVAQRNLEIAYHNTGYYDRRVSELQERLRQSPDDRDARLELGRAFAALGQFDEAVAEFEEILAHHPRDVAAVIQLGLAEKARGRLEIAADWFEQAQALDPASSVVQFYLGEVLYNRGLNDAALVALQRAVQLNPDNANAHYLMAFVLGDMGRHQEARAASKRAIELNPPLARAQANLSLERIKSNERKSQPYLVREALEMEVVEGRELAHFNLGLAFRQKGYYVEALREYRLALERGEDRRLVLQAMAEVHLLRRDFGPALELYETLVLEVPDSPKLWNERGVVLHQAGRVDEALASYHRAAEIDAKYALAWNNLGVALAHQGGNEDAVEAFRTALNLQSTFAAARLNLALLLFHIRRLQLALEAYRQVLADEPKNASAWNGVGLVLVELKRFADARNAFARAVEADPRHAGAHYNLSFTLSNLGDFDGALARHQAGARARSVLRRPEVRAHHRSAVRGSHHRGGAADLGRCDGRVARLRIQLRPAAAGQHLSGAGAARAGDDEPGARRSAGPGARLREQGVVRPGGGGGDARHAARRRRDRGHDADRRSVRETRPARRSAGALPRGTGARSRADRGAAG